MTNTKKSGQKRRRRCKNAASVRWESEIPGPRSEPSENKTECAARRRLRLLGVTENTEGFAVEDIGGDERCFFELKALRALFDCVACGGCGEVGTLEVSFGQHMAFAREIRLACRHCPFNVQEFSCFRHGGSDSVTQGFDVNSSMVLAFTELGCGPAALNKFAAVMGLDGMSSATCARLTKKVGAAHKEVAANVLKTAVLAVRNAYGQHGDGDDGGRDDSDDGGRDDSDDGGTHDSDDGGRDDSDDGGRDDSDDGGTHDSDDGGRDDSDDGGTHDSDDGGRDDSDDGGTHDSDDGGTHDSDDGGTHDSDDEGRAGVCGGRGDRGRANGRGDRGRANGRGDRGRANGRGDRGRADGRGDRGRANGRGDRGRANGRGDRGRADGRGDRGRAGVYGDRGRADGRGDRGRANGRGDRGRADGRGDRGRADGRGDRGRADGRGDRGRANCRGDRGRANGRGDRARANDRGDRGRANGRGDRGRADGRGDRGRADGRGDRGRAGVCGGRADGGRVGVCGGRGDGGRVGVCGGRGDGGRAGVCGGRDGGRVGVCGGRGDGGRVGVCGGRGDGGRVGVCGGRDGGRVGVCGGRGDGGRVGVCGGRGDGGRAGVCGGRDGGRAGGGCGDRGRAGVDGHTQNDNSGDGNEGHDIGGMGDAGQYADEGGNVGEGVCVRGGSGIEDDIDEWADMEEDVSDGESANDDGDGGSDDENDDDDRGPPVDVMVSFDGTWQKRGFTSKYGVGVVIDVITGLVLDFEVLSKYCHACEINESVPMTADERHEWKRMHAPVCEKNFEGSSKAMEKEAAIRMWQRSITQNNMRYTSVLSDGDSVAYKAICENCPYEVTKLECVNHCDKRFGTALRKKTKEQKLGGRGYGALTARACTTLQTYYRNAIMKNLNDPAAMQHAILASFKHCSSTDNSPQHDDCPDGMTSWCFFKRALAHGEQPPPHKQHIGTPLSAEVARAIQPIYERMSDPGLLARLKHGKTQNANECLNGLIWRRCPKTVFVGATRINAAVASAVSHFNQGCAHLTQVMQHLGVSTTTHLQDYGQRQDRQRVLQADKQADSNWKRHRKDKKTTTRWGRLAQEAAEGPTYGPGLLNM